MENVRKCSKEVAVVGAEKDLLQPEKELVFSPSLNGLKRVLWNQPLPPQLPTSEDALPSVTAPLPHGTTSAWVSIKVILEKQDI